MKLKNKIDRLIRAISDRVTGNGLMQESNCADGTRYITPGMPQAIRSAAADGIVLLHNDGTLPFENHIKIAIFGRCQMDWFYVGYGSGGDVKPPYRISFDQAMQQADMDGYVRVDEQVRKVYQEWTSHPDNVPSDGWWGHWPMSYPEMPLSASLVQDAAKRNAAAVVVIGRAAGEDRENRLTPGSYYLTQEEVRMLDLVTAHFEKVVVVVDAGNVIDMAWTERYKHALSAVVYAWQGGMESGNALADVLTGRVNPSGKLTDTIARHYEDYPSAAHFGGLQYNEYAEDIFVGYRYFETFAPQAVLYPFGFGLSYTQFAIAARTFTKTESGVCVTAEITNTGKRAGREVVQLYAECPQGVLGKASRTLVAFAKTPLLRAGESCRLTLQCADYDYASYDDGGYTGNSNAYVLEAGEYRFHIGNSVRNTQVAGAYTLDATRVLCTTRAVCRVQHPFDRFHATVVDGKLVNVAQQVPRATYLLRDRIAQSLPSACGPRPYHGETWQDVVSGKLSLDDFVAALNDEELQSLVRGYGAMNAPQGVRGNAGVYGGYLSSMEQKGVPVAVTTDGPAGIRIGHYTALLPCGTCLACTWDREAVESLYALVAQEMHHYKTDILLGAGMNIHRNPLCGRNFEYFSEDPLVSGIMAAAFVTGLQNNGKAACPKHFACNNQEVRRNTNDSRVSERALREIYCKAFEICVKISKPVNIMTSYNKINGVWSHYNYDLVTTLLREEWGFDGTVITDWWMRRSKSPEFPKLADNAYRVRAQVDVLMPGDMRYVAKGYKKDKKLLACMRSKDGITRGEMERCAKNVLRTLLWLHGERVEKV